jgi:hypothetical protein
MTAKAPVPPVSEDTLPVDISVVRQKRRERARRYAAKHPDRVKAKWAAYVAANPEREKKRQRINNLRRKYSLTLSAFSALVDSQNGRCAICRSLFVPGKTPHVDHDHATGRVRGLLCVDCNRGLGSFRDSPNSLLAAIAYLKRGD